MDKSNDPKYMEKYLETAMKLETYLYSAKETKRKTAALHNEKQERADQLEQRYNETFLTLVGNDKDEYVEQNSVKTKTIVKPIILCILFFCVAIAAAVFAFAAAKGSVAHALSILWEIEIVPVGLAILFLCMAIRRAKLKKVRTTEVLENEFNQSQQIAFDENDTVWDKKEALDNQVATLKESYWALDKQENSLQDSLNTLYSEGVLDVAYRSLECVCTLYGYLKRGRCTTIKGPGGIYDTFESDYLKGLIIRQLQNISSQLAQIQQNQGELYRALNEGNRISEMTLREIKTGNRQMIQKLDTIAYEQRRHDAVDEWLKWQNYYR